MYSRRFTEMFPSEELAPMWECVNPQCFYSEHLFKTSELECWVNAWCVTLQDLIIVPRCPSCAKTMEVYENAETQNDKG